MSMALNSLPDELLLEIFSYCKVENLILSISKVCTRWERICRDQILWKNITFHVTPWLVKHVKEIIQSCCHRLHSITIYSDAEEVAKTLTSDLPLHTINLAAAVTISSSTFLNITTTFPKIKCFGIVFRNCEIQNYLEGFKNFQCIENISVSYSGRQPGLLSQILKHCPSLTGLNIRGTGCFWLNDEDLSCLINEKSESLLRLELDGVLLTNKSLALLKKCEKLQHLGIASSGITSEKLAPMRDLSSLRCLNLHQAKNISSEFYKDFFSSNQLFNLTELKLFQCRFSDKAALLLTQNCCKLRILKLKIISKESSNSEENIYDLYLGSKNWIANKETLFTNIQEVFETPDFDNFTDEIFTDAGFVVIIITLKYLKELEIVSKNVTERYFHLILSHLRFLLYCRVLGNTCYFSWPFNKGQLELA